MHTSLGYYGKHSLPPLCALWEAQKAPSFVNCQSALGNQAIQRIINPEPFYQISANKGHTRCKSLFCPSCHSERMVRQYKTLTRAFKSALSKGYSLSLLTLTLYHTLQSPLKELITALTKAFSKARQGSPFARMKAKTRFLGVINVFEVNYSTENGWNPHIHALIIARTRAGATQSALFLKERYMRFLERQEYQCNEFSTDNRLVYDAEGLANYLSKQWFMPISTSLTPFGLAREALNGNEHSKVLFQECFYALQNKKMRVVSPSLKQHLSLKT